MTPAERWAKAIDDHEMITVFCAESKSKLALAFCVKDGWHSTVKDSGITMLAKELQPSKAAVRIAVTDGW